MPHISAFKESKYLTKDDVGKGLLVTIRDCVQQNVAPDNQAEELKWCLAFDEQDKLLVCNPTNAQIIAEILGSEQTEEWIGQQIVLYTDPNVMFAAKRVGGIRARAVRPDRIQNQSPRKAGPPQQHTIAGQGQTRSVPTRPPPAPQRPAQPQRVAQPPPPQPDAPEAYNQEAGYQPGDESNEENNDVPF